MMKCIRDIFSILASGIFFGCLLYACASIGSPQGGPEDRTPPRMVSSIPAPNALNYTKDKIEIIFDELVTIENPMENVIITPPQTQLPVIKASGKKVLVELKDSLRPNTTYTIDFSDAIADNNEKNVLENFSFAFSTGETLDSLVVGGTLLNAENLEPMPGILIGIHQNLEDSAFVKLPFFRTTKTNEKGQFWIRNVAAGTYRIYALNDLNRDYKFDQPGEEIAFGDSLVTPSFVPDIRMDTIWKDSITIDSVIRKEYNRFIPEDVVLFLFKEKFERQYLRKFERPFMYKFSLSFNTKPETFPEVKLLNAEAASDWAIIEESEGGKTLNYWIKDSLIYTMDTLDIDVSYYESDTLNNLVLTNDTLAVFMKRAPKRTERKEKDKKGKDQEEKIEFLEMLIEAPSSMEVYDSLKVRFSEPLVRFDSTFISLKRKEDTTTWKAVPFSVFQDKLNPLQYIIVHQWDYGKEYKLSVDSAVFYGIYGKWNSPREVSFKAKAVEEYGSLYVNMSGFENRGFGELLDGSDKVIRKVPLKDGALLFMDLKPSKYYLRYIEDANGNGVWDTGNYKDHLQPEKVYYYPDYIDIRQNWDDDESWDVTGTPVTRQKLLEITKNKPKEKKKNDNVQNSQTGPNNAQSPRLIAPGMGM